MTIRGVLLDLDGTLLDSNEAHAVAWARAMAEHGHDVPVARVREAIGMGGDNLLPSILNITKDSPEGAAIDRRQREIFQVEYQAGLKPMPGARALLQRMHDQGLRLVVASSAQADEVEAGLKIVGASELIYKQTSASDAKNSKPDPDIIHAALQQVGYPPEQVLLLGDTPYDVQAATTAEVGVIALLCGGFDAAALRGALAVYRNPADLLAHFDASPLAAAPAAPEDRQSRLGQSMKVTTDHQQIRQWISDRGGVPAMVKRTGDEPDAGQLVVDFSPRRPEEDIIDISWTAFFERFEEQQLALRYDDAGAGASQGDTGTSYEFVPRHDRSGQPSEQR